MHAFRQLFKPSTTRALMGWLLLAFLAVHGHAGVLRQMLGTAHRHDGHPAATGPMVTELGAMNAGLATAETARAQVANGLTALRAWRQAHHAHPHASGLSDHAHRHETVERHHHDIGDESVAALDDGGAAGQRGAEGPAAAPVLGAEVPPGLARAHGPATSAAAAMACAWPRAPARSWQNALARLPERPPRG